MRSRVVLFLAVLSGAAAASLFSAIPDCPTGKRGDSICDFECNRWEFDFDGGDCCPSDCKAGGSCDLDLAAYYNVYRTGTRRSVLRNADLLSSRSTLRYNDLTGREVAFDAAATATNAAEK